MSLRRILPITLALAALLALGGGALAVAQSGDDDPPPRERAAHRAVGTAMLDRVGDQLARELGLPADRVRAGLRDFVDEQHARYDSPAERRAAERELRDAPDAVVRLRDELAAGLGEELGVPGARVTAAARALIAERLDDLVEDRWMTAAERATALACFDDPGACARLADRAGGLGALLGRP